MTLEAGRIWWAVKKPTYHRLGIRQPYHALIVHDNGQDLLLDLAHRTVSSSISPHPAPGLRHRDLSSRPARVMFSTSTRQPRLSPIRARRSASRALDFPTRQGKERPARCWPSGGWIRRGEEDVGLKPDLQRAPGARA